MPQKLLKKTFGRIIALSTGNIIAALPKTKRETLAFAAADDLSALIWDGEKFDIRSC
jgi:hypothetical protein